MICLIIIMVDTVIFLDQIVNSLQVSNWLPCGLFDGESMPPDKIRKLRTLGVYPPAYNRINFKSLIHTIES